MRGARPWPGDQTEEISGDRVAGKKSGDPDESGPHSKLFSFLQRKLQHLVACGDEKFVLIVEDHARR